MAYELIAVAIYNKEINMSQRRTNLQIVEDKRKELSQAIVANNAIIQTLAPELQEDFKKNFLEFASQDYLLSAIEPREVIRFAVNITKIGLSIAPSANEIYIIPYDTKVNGKKVMLPQAIIPMNGMQQLAYKSGFMLIADPVYKFNDTECEAARHLTRLQQSQLSTANTQWIDNHFIGYDVILKDLKGNLGEQVYFVDVNYVKTATKTNKDTKWSLSTWTHKAVRKAYKQFLVPRERALEEFEKLEQLNDDKLINTDVISSKKLTTSIENAINSFGLTLTKNNGTAIVTGTTYGKEDSIKKLGFVVNNKQWCMEYDGPSVANNDVVPIKSPARQLMTYLVEKGIEKDRVGEFVKDVLGASSADVESIKLALADKDALDEMIGTFLSEPISDEDIY